MANYTVINGQARSLNQWVLLLVPKRTGVLKIPPIAIGASKTEESQIKVEALSSPSAQEDVKSPAVKLVTEASELKPYVNQQVVYTVKLYISRRLLDADYQPPQIKDALMVSLGQPRQYQTLENGVAYTVQELQYAFFPQKSGTLKITPPEFHALVFDAVPGQVQIKGKVTSLEVQPAPALDKKVSWLPARAVTLQETYDNESSSIAEGSMIVRTITISAIGAAAELLPKLTFQSNNQFSVYPEVPSEETHFEHSNLKGVAVIKATYLFNKPGTIVIPPLKLPWFNTVSGKPQVASLPSRTIQVAPSAASKTSLPAWPTRVNSQDSITAMRDNPDVSVQSSLLQVPVQNPLAWAIAAGFAFAWLVTLWLWWRSRRSRAGNGIRSLRKKVLLACRRNDPSALKEALLAWALKTWAETPCFNLGDLERLIGMCDLQKSINTLSQQLYQAQPQKWSGAEFWRSFIAYKPPKTRRQKKEKFPLPSINP